MITEDYYFELVLLLQSRCRPPLLLTAVVGCRYYTGDEVEIFVDPYRSDSVVMTDLEQHDVPQSRVLGSLGQFNPARDNIASYLERVQLYFEVNSIGEDRRVPILIGAETYETLRSLLAPALPREKTFKDLVEILKKHYDPQLLVIAERYRFYQRS